MILIGIYVQYFLFDQDVIFGLKAVIYAWLLDIVKMLLEKLFVL